MFSFQGRASRKEFWNAVVLLVIFDIVLAGTYFGVNKYLGGFSEIPMPVMAVILFVFSALVVPLVVNLFAVTTRRYHDRGKSGLWAVLWVIVLPPLIECGFLKGQEGPNQYGDAVKEEVAPVAPLASQANPPKPAPAPVPQASAPAPAPAPVSQQPPVASVPQAAAPAQVKSEPVLQTASIQIPAPAPSPVSTPAPKIEVPKPQPSAPVTPPQASPAPSVAAQAAVPLAQTPSQPSPSQSAQAPHGPSGVPQARSMSEMLAELQKLAEKQGEIANKAAASAIPPKAPMSASAPAPAPVAAPAPKMEVPKPQAAAPAASPQVPGGSVTGEQKAV